MKRLAVIGSQWGDEGKGKVTDFFAQKADVVVRYQGGNNAGHSVVFDGRRYSLQSIPSGIFNPETINIMGNGMVVNPVSLVSELEKLHTAGITRYRLYISNRAQVVMPYHIDLDGAYEALKGGNQIGTTKKGIGPAYADKYDRVGIRMGDLLDADYFAQRLKDALAIKNAQLQTVGLPTYDFEPLYKQFCELGERFRPMICDTSELLNDQIDNGKKVLFEGAQGMMLGIDHGTYPFVTSSSPSAASIPLGAGIAPQKVESVLGVAKAYCTRVGEGPFPTELSGETANTIRERGHEYGTVTGRPRRVGWFDAVVANYTRRLGGIDFWGLMLFDVLSGLDKVSICTAYELDGRQTTTMPSTIAEYSRCKPVLIEMEGWKEDISGVRSFDELPEAAKAYIAKIEELTKTPVGLVSVGADRTATILRNEELKQY